MDKLPEGNGFNREPGATQLKQAIVKEIFRLYLDGVDTGTIARKLPELVSSLQIRSGIRVIVYSRCVNVPQSNGAIERQEEICAPYAEWHGWEVVGRFSDANRNGTPTAGCGGLAQALAAAREGDVDVLLVDQFYRISRNASDMRRIVKELEQLGVALCAVAEGVANSDAIQLRRRRRGNG